MPACFNAFRRAARSGFDAVSCKRKRRSNTSTLSRTECAEPRCLLTALGNAPVLNVTWVDRGVVTGHVVDDNTASGSSSGSSIQIEVDLYNDGTVDHIINADYDSSLDRFNWEFELPGNSGTFEAYDIALTPVESLDDLQQHGTTNVVTVPPATNNAPILKVAWANGIALWGQMTDEELNLGGTYDVEVAVGSQDNGFQSWGAVEFEGEFWLNNTAPRDVGQVVLFVRIREVTSGSQAYSNVVRIEYDSGTQMGTEGYSASRQTPAPVASQNDGRTDSGTPITDSIPEIRNNGRNRTRITTRSGNLPGDDSSAWWPVTASRFDPASSTRRGRNAPATSFDDLSVDEVFASGDEMVGQWL